MAADGIVLPQLPVSDVLDEIGRALEDAGNAVLVAPPGAGKTTIVPLFLLDAPWLAPGDRIIMLEPRRLAARAAARRMASLLGEEVGKTVGYRMRLDTRVSAATRIEVVTEGVFQRMILENPELPGVGLVVFDEFHERSLDADFGLALALDVQRGLRETLKLLVMSATLDGARIAALLGDARIVESRGRSHAVDIRYRPRAANTRIEDAMADAIGDALIREEGNILAFLPGQGEIHRTAARLEDRLPDDAFLAPLFGAMDMRDQDRAIAPAPEGRRKIVLATSLAESSITIDGIRVVIDSGLARVPVFEPAFAVTRLETVRASQASVKQRAGRAGRTAPGVAIRLWAAEQTASLPDFDTPEILATDLSRLVLDAAAFGVLDPASLSFLDSPPGPALNEARQLLKLLGAMDEGGRVTEKGETMRATGLPVRSAAMIAEGQSPAERLARAYAALLLSERGLGGNDIDLDARLRAMITDNSKRANNVRQLARRLAGAASDTRPAKAAAGTMLLAAFPDRLAKARPAKPGHFVMANGRGAVMDEADPLAAAPFIVVADLTGKAANARILSAASVDEAEIETAFAGRISVDVHLSFDTGKGELRARSERRLGQLVLAAHPVAVEPSEATVEALLAALRRHGADVLKWTDGLKNLRKRLSWLHAALGEPWPPMDDEALVAEADEWLAPYLAGQTGFASMPENLLRNALLSRTDPALGNRIDELAPSHYQVSTGSRITLQYPADGSAPLLPVRVQELYGLKSHPAIGGGDIALVVEMHSPAGRPIQKTQDLPAFWRGSWAEVRTEMRGRYPKHVWPEDPMSAEPTRRAKPRGR